MPGIRVDRQTLDGKMGNAVVKLRDAIADVQKVTAFLGRVGKPQLIDPAGPFKYTSDEADAFLAVFGRLDSGSRVLKGEQAGVADQNGLAVPFAYMLGIDDLTGLS